MAESFHLSFAIGPVQGFLGQARRTRDLWAGSWLLSYLAETALVAAEKAGGTAIIPARSEQQRGCVTSRQTVVGGMPNRFEVTFATREQAVAAGEAARTAFDHAWQMVAGAVWNKFVAPVASLGDLTESIWQRQIQNFWEVSWVVAKPEGNEKTIGRLAAARKAFRNCPAVPEAGVKCSLMGTLQELSGCFGDKQRKFWVALNDGTGAHDLRDGERLCAISLIKRLFPRVMEEAIGTDIAGDLKQQVSWPSIGFLAALPWLREVDTICRDDACAFIGQAQAAPGNVAGGIGNSDHKAAKDAGIPWAGMDAAAWFTSAVRNNDWQLTEASRSDLMTRLGKLYEKVGRAASNNDTGGSAPPKSASKTAPKPPVPFYALLLMDGDSMGMLLGKLGDPGILSHCLGAFAEKVDGIVRAHDGRTIYAGGDDVMAVLPAAMAFPAAAELAKAYRESFPDVKEATISGAIVYSHWRHPMQQVVGLAHALLDERAKEATGRDSLAVSIIQGKGPNAIWAAPWPFIRGEVGNTPLTGILPAFAADDGNEDAAAFNASYLYKLRQRFSHLFQAMDTSAGQFGKIEGTDGIFLDIAHAEFRRRLSREERAVTPPAATREHVEKLMILSRRWTRNKNGEIKGEKDTFGFDGWRVARFMNEVREGRVGEHE